MLRRSRLASNHRSPSRIASTPEEKCIGAPEEKCTIAEAGGRRPAVRVAANGKGRCVKIFEGGTISPCQIPVVG